AFHPDNSVNNGEAPRQESMELGDGAVNADLVKLVFRPSVDRAGNEAEEVLHGERGARPVMCLHLGERDDQIGAKYGVWKVDLVQLREAAQRRDVVAIEIGEQGIE